MSEDVFKPGEVLGGKYRVVRPLGAGGMAVVLEAEHIRLGHRAALKVLRGALAASEAVVSRFEREGRALSRLKSTNVVRVFDVDATPSGAPFLVMEYLDGEDLETELARRGPLPIGEAVGYTLQASAAMQEAHGLGIIHRDLKPANLFLAKEGKIRVVKVLDFGIARDALPDGEDVRLTRTEAVMGTPLYMAPEQFRSTRDVDARADVWALGATLYELLTGHPPFVGTASTIGVAVVTEEPRSIESLRPEVPPALRDAISRALAKSRDARFPSMQAFGDALAPFGDAVVIAPRASAASFHESEGMTAAPTLLAAGVTPPDGATETSRGTSPATGAAVTHDTRAESEPRPVRAWRPWPFVAVIAVVAVTGGLLLHRSSPTTSPPVVAAPVPPAPLASVPPAAVESPTPVPTSRPDSLDASTPPRRRHGHGPSAPDPGSATKPPSPDASGHPLFFPP